MELNNSEKPLPVYNSYYQSHVLKFKKREITHCQAAQEFFASRRFATYNVRHSSMNALQIDDIFI